MLSLSPTTTFGALSLWAAYLVLLAYRQHKRNKLLPPGPKKLPFIGNVLDMPKEAAGWETFARWSKQYNSDILHADVLGTSIVVLNSYAAARDLLDKRSGVFSSRPHLTMLHDLSGFGWGFAMLPYGEEWRASRKLFNKHMNPSDPRPGHPRELKYVREFLVKLLDQPDAFMKHIRHTIGANAMSSIYGIPIRPSNDPNLEGAEKVIKVGGEFLVPGGFLVDAFPVLRHVPSWFPGATFHELAARMKFVLPLIREVPYAAAEKLRREGLHEPCFIANGLNEIDASSKEAARRHEEIELLKNVAAQAFVAAADTSVSTVGSFFLAMTMYPGVQRKAQAELDEVLRGRLPTHEDIDDLPYLEAIAREIYRWHPVLPQAVPHVSTEDDVYQGYLIPAGSMVIPNQWAMLHDETAYPEPFVFRPERHLKDGKIDHSVINTAEMAFGFGRRACPGRHLAHSMFKITAASVLSTFNLLKKLDDDGNEIQPKEEYFLAAQCQPLPFPCLIRPRSAEASSLVETCRLDLVDAK